MVLKKRAKVEKKLGHPLEDEDWNILVDFKYAEYIDDADAFDALLTRARQLSRGRRPTTRSGRFPLPPVTAGGAPVTARARALSQLVADEAAEDSRVVDYRARHLGGRTIAFADARDLLRSLAACRVPASALKSHGVSLLGHRSRIVRSEHVGCDWCWPDDRGWVEYEIDVGGTKTSVTTIDVPDRRRVLVYQAEGQPELGAGVGNGSPLDELLDLADALAGAYRWRSSEAAAFVLEGRVPFVRPVEVTTSFHVALTGRKQATITLAVDPAVPASEVARAYNEAQLLALLKPPKATAARTMAAVAFEAERRRGQPDLSWRDLMSSFNDLWAKHPDRGKDKPFGSASAFFQAVGRGRESLGGLTKLPPHVESMLQRDVGGARR